MGISKKNPNPAGTSLLDHIAELRQCVMRSLLAMIAASIVALIFSKKIFHIMQIPMLRVLPEGNTFIATAPFESYVAYFKIALLTGFFTSTPVVFYFIWRFVAPALTKKEKKLIIPFSGLSALLFTGGALFGYFVVFPTGFYYVNLILEGTEIALMPKMSDYLKVATTLLLSFGICFELPLFIFLLGKLGLMDYTKIKRYRRYVIVGLFVLAAVLTPGPDVISQCLLAIPLWGLYELGGLSLIVIKKRKKEKEDDF